MNMHTNRHRRIMIAVLLIILMVFSAGCMLLPAKPTEDPVEAPTVSATEDASLNSLRQAMVGTPQLFAVAYFGYHDNWDTDIPVDPFEVMQTQAPQLCADLPFLLEIPKERIIGENGDLFCIVPLDTDAQVAVSLGEWDDQSQTHIYEQSLYIAQSGEPILLFCNNFGWEPDTRLHLSGPSGDVVWYPRTDDYQRAMPLRNDNWEELFLDFSPYREMLAANYRSVTENVEWEAVIPTQEDLIGSTWVWQRYLKDGSEVSCSVTFDQDYLNVRWYDGIDAMEHIYDNAPWTLEHKDGYGVLTIDFAEFAGVLRYDVLYSRFYDELYIAQDVLQEDMNIGWEPLYRYLSKPIAPESVEMAGTWELVWTEIEGYQEEAEPGTCFLEITTDYAGLFRISYTDYAFPEENYQNKELIVFPFEMYYGCGNDQWTATVNHTGRFGTEYRITLLYNDTLLLQRYWEVDGAPMVSYGSYRRVSE